MPYQVSATSLLLSDPHLVEQVYSGKANRCCCGCSGKYTKGDKAVRSMVTRMNNRARMTRTYGNDCPSQWCVGDNHVAIETDTRVLIVYPKMDHAKITLHDDGTITITRKDA